MRKTILWLDPLKTPEYYNPKVDRIGKRVNMKFKSRSNINRAKRFPQYELDANRLGKNVGPGVYGQEHFSIVSNMKKTGKVPFIFYKHRDGLNNSHYFRDYSTSIPNFLRTT